MTIVKYDNIRLSRAPNTESELGHGRRFRRGGEEERPGLQLPRSSHDPRQLHVLRLLTVARFNSGASLFRDPRILSVLYPLYLSHTSYLMSPKKYYPF